MQQYLDNKNVLLAPPLQQPLVSASTPVAVIQQPLLFPNLQPMECPMSISQILTQTGGKEMRTLSETPNIAKPLSAGSKADSATYMGQIQEKVLTEFQAAKPHNATTFQPVSKELSKSLASLNKTSEIRRLLETKTDTNIISAKRKVMQRNDGPNGARETQPSSSLIVSSHPIMSQLLAHSALNGETLSAHPIMSQLLTHSALDGEAYEKKIQSQTLTRETQPTPGFPVIAHPIMSQLLRLDYGGLGLI